MKDNTHLFYFTWQLRKPHFGIILDELDDILKNHHHLNVLFIYCDGGLKPCYTNREGNRAKCGLCNHYMNIIIKKYSNRVLFIPLSSIQITQNKKVDDVLKYQSLADIKKLIYKQINIGYPALSSYISFTRNQNPLIDQKFKLYFNHLLKYEMKLIDQIMTIWQNFNIKNVTVFNGRTADVRPILEFAKTKFTSVKVLELIDKSETEYYKDEFIDHLPHSISYRSNEALKIWGKLKNDENLVLKGKDFFQKRRDGKLVRDRKAYTENQLKNKLPEYWDNNFENIVIFNSSEDEYAAIGDEFELLALFKNQLEGIKWLLTNCHKQNRHYYLRIHPNLKDVTYSYHTDLYTLENDFNNITIVAADSECSTYALIDNCDKVITFGSTVGVEATFWGKPSIQLAGSFYSYLNTTYTPKKLSDIKILIDDLNLKPKPKVNALKYGFYLVNYQEFRTLSSHSPQKVSDGYFNFGLSIKIMNAFKSSFLSKIYDRGVRFFYLKVISSFMKDEIILPKEEAKT